MADRVISLSACKPADVELIRELPTMEGIGTVLIDDFHKHDDKYEQSVADHMKVLADEERHDSKAVVLGINKAGGRRGVMTAPGRAVSSAGAAMEISPRLRFEHPTQRTPVDLE
jgi:DNA integrity scanning protein DisA with diadenylate cyclase activity